MGTFLYLVQGKAELVKRFLSLRDRDDVDAIFLTYDQQLDGAVFLPNSTWAQGRNVLLGEAMQRDEPHYYIFLDDDVSFVRGDFPLFERQLLRLNPAAAMPVFYPKTIRTVFGLGRSYESTFRRPLKTFQICRRGDSQFIAFHRDVVRDRLVLPYQEHFDSVSWWATCNTQQLLVFDLYRNSVLQFNNVVVSNEGHSNYQKTSFKDVQRGWFDRQFQTPMRPRFRVVNPFCCEGIRDLAAKTLRHPKAGCKSAMETVRVLLGTLAYTRRLSHRFRCRTVLKMLRPESELLEQYTQGAERAPQPKIDR